MFKKSTHSEILNHIWRGCFFVFLLSGLLCSNLAKVNAQGLPADQFINPDPEHELYEADPLLVEAFEIYNDVDRPRDDAIDLFEKYIEQNPQSPFVAEVYFRIGALYSIPRRSDEPLRVDQQIKYYEEAHKRWGEAFSYLNQTAWATLANRSNTLGDRKAYYDWLISFEDEANPDRVYVTREIEQVFNGRQPEITEDEKARVITAWTKTNLAGIVYTSEQNILYWARNNYDYLVDLASTYPNRRLGKEAKKRLNELDLEKDVNSPSAVLSSPEFLNPKDSALVTDSRSKYEADGDLSAVGGMHAGTIGKASDHSTLFWIGLILTIIVIVLMLFLYRIRSNRLNKSI